MAKKRKRKTRNQTIESISVNSTFEKKKLEQMSDQELINLYNSLEIDEWLEKLDRESHQPMVNIELNETEATILKNYLHDGQHDMLRDVDDEDREEQWPGQEKEVRSLYDLVWKIIKMVEKSGN